MRPFAGALVCLVAFAGCATQAPTMIPATQPAQAPSIPVQGQELHLRFAPRGLSVPGNAILVEQIDQVNNITLVFAAPTGAELAAYYREALPLMGFEVTADANNSLLFEDDQWQGGFTAAGSHSALTLRTDWE